MSIHYLRTRLQALADDAGQLGLTDWSNSSLDTLMNRLQPILEGLAGATSALAKEIHGSELIPKLEELALNREVNLRGGPHRRAALDALAREIADKGLKTPLRVRDDGLEALLEAAKHHGAQSDPDHEVGDLQELVRSCWAVMKPKQRDQVLAEHAELVEEWGT